MTGQVFGRQKGFRLYPFHHRMNDINLRIVRRIFPHNFWQFVWQIDALCVEPAVDDAVAVLRQNAQLQISAIAAVTNVRTDYLVVTIFV